MQQSTKTEMKVQLQFVIFISLIQFDEVVSRQASWLNNWYQKVYNTWPSDRFKKTSTTEVSKPKWGGQINQAQTGQFVGTAQNMPSQFGNPRPNIATFGTNVYTGNLNIRTPATQELLWSLPCARVSYLGFCCKLYNNRCYWVK